MGLFELPMEVAGKDLELRKRLERKLQDQNRCCIPIRNNARLAKHQVQRVENYHETIVS
jgi:hypothetical protein